MAPRDSGSFLSTLPLRRFETRRHQIRNPENTTREPAADLNLASIRQAAAGTGDLGFLNVQGFHCFHKSGSFESPCGEHRSLMLEWIGEQPVDAAILRLRPDNVHPILVISEAIDDDRASIGKDRLNLEYASHGVNVVPQRVEIHVRALLDKGDRNFRK